MNTQTYTIQLSEHERDVLQYIISDKKEDTATILRANILLLSDSTNTHPLSVVKIAELAGSTRQTVTKIRNIYHEEGFDTALHVLERNRNRDCMKHSSVFLEQIKAMIKETPVDGRPKWTVRSISKECMDRKYVEHINPTTIMRILKENNIKL